MVQIERGGGMNKYQEALDFVKETLNAREPNVMNHLCANRRLDHELKELVERATPKKPYDKGDYYICPNCSNDRCVCGKFCPKCGQAIDWSVEDDTEI